MRTLSILLAVWFLLVAPARAASPLDYTRTTLEQARVIVASSQTHNEKLAALSVLFSKFLDTDEMGRDALGPHWSSFTPASAEGVPRSVPRTSPANLRAKAPALRESRLRLCGRAVDRRRRIVDTKIVTPRDQFDVTYRLIPAGEKWMATAITVEDVSLTANLGSSAQRSPFPNSVDDVLTLMRRKYGNASGEAQS